MKCIKCETENPLDANFCRNCGQNIYPQRIIFRQKGIFEYYIYTLRKYAVIEGRASRKEYWSFFLISLFLLGIIPFVGIIILVPSLTVAVRRMHDVGKCGWYILIPIYNIVLLCTKGDHFYNEYGRPIIS